MNKSGFANGGRFFGRGGLRLLRWESISPLCLHAGEIYCYGCWASVALNPIRVCLLISHCLPDEGGGFHSVAPTEVWPVSACHFLITSCKSQDLFCLIKYDIAVIMWINHMSHMMVGEQVDLRSVEVILWRMLFLESLRIPCAVSVASVCLGLVGEREFVFCV